MCGRTHRSRTTGTDTDTGTDMDIDIDIDTPALKRKLGGWVGGKTGKSKGREGGWKYVRAGGQELSDAIHLYPQMAFDSSASGPDSTASGPNGIRLNRFWAPEPCTHPHDISLHPLSVLASVSLFLPHHSLTLSLPAPPPLSL
jgi:hypothetical protein